MNFHHIQVNIGDSKFGTVNCNLPLGRFNASTDSDGADATFIYYVCRDYLVALY